MLPYFPFGKHFNDKIGTVLLTENEPLVDVDAQYRTDVLLKRQQLTELPDYYAQAQPGHETAQWEVVELVLQHLARFWPDSFSLGQSGDVWQWNNRLLGETATFTFGDSSTLPLMPLDWVGRQIQEDLLLLSGSDATLVAGQLCFGNDWSLNEKIGLPFWDIHAPITPIVEPMMRAAQKLMERLPVGRPVWRLNWSIKATDQLDMTSRHSADLAQRLARKLPQLIAGAIGDQLFIRIERQTLTRLPQSQAILFGVHTYQNRLDYELEQRPDAAQCLLNVLTTAPPALLDYKSITPFLLPLVDYLNRRVPTSAS